MATESLIDAWGPYRDAIYGYYEIAADAVRGDRELEDEEIAEVDRALQGVVERSQALTEIGVAQLRLAVGPEYDRVAVRLLAAGAVDVAVACEALRVCPDSPGSDPVFVREEGDGLQETALELLAEADALFSNGGGVDPEGSDEPDDGDDDPGGSPIVAGSSPLLPGDSGLTYGSGGLEPLAGGAVDPMRLKLLDAADRSFDKLTDAAAEPALKFTSGAISGIAGGFHLAATLDPFDKLTALAEAVGVVKRRVVRLLASGFRKLLGVSGQTSSDLVVRAIRIVETKAVKLVRPVVQRAVRDVLAWLVNCGAAKQGVEGVLLDPGALQGRGATSAEVALAGLTRAYASEMEWTAKVGQWLSWAGPFISTLAVHVGGPLLVVGLNAVGLGFVLYTLDVRVDGHGLPTRVSSVVQIIELA
jgi:hypothetical protein